jgi:hypothetical protein
MISTGKRRRLNMDRLLSQSFQTMPSQLMQQSHRALHQQKAASDAPQEAHRAAAIARRRSRESVTAESTASV